MCAYYNVMRRRVRAPAKGGRDIGADLEISQIFGLANCQKHSSRQYFRLYDKMFANDLLCLGEFCC